MAQRFSVVSGESPAAANAISPIAEIVAELKAGRMVVVVVDDEELGFRRALASGYGSAMPAGARCMMFRGCRVLHRCGAT